MKKIILLLIILCSATGFAQFTENFENSTNLSDTGWKMYTNGVGGTKVWGIGTATDFPSTPPCEGVKAAVIDREFVGQGNTEMDYLVTPQITVPTNGEMRFISRQRLSGDQSTRYRVYVSINSDPSLLSEYQQINEWSENEMNPPGTNPCNEQKVDLKTYAGKKVFIAFVRVLTQTGSGITGDTWFVDNVRVFPKCNVPTNGVATNVWSTQATLTWADNQASKWDVYYGVSGITPPDANTVPTNSSVIKPLPITGLQPSTSYEFYVRGNCNYWGSDWAGPFTFKTSPFGTFCAEPLMINNLPFQETSNTANFLDFVDGLGANCGASPSSTDYLGGNEAYYAYKSATNGLISVKLVASALNSGVFVYDTCPENGSSTPCLAGMANTGSGERLVKIPVEAGKTYYIVVSSSAQTQTYAYTIVVQREECTPPVGSVPTQSDVTTESVALSWTNPTNAVNWQIDIQSLTAPIPSGSGNYTASGDPSTIISGLSAASQYRYYVRSECAPGVYSAWAGPYAFNTAICDNTGPGTKCNYDFVMTDTAGNGWNGATMQVKQNNIVVATIGSDFKTGSGPIKTAVSLCTGLKYELFWENAGTAPDQCVVSIVNSFGQTIFVKPSKVGTPGTTVHEFEAKCDAPICNITVNGLNATNVLAHQADLKWSAPATSQWGWDVYVVLSGSPKPDKNTVPTYAVTMTNPLTVTQYTDLTTNPSTKKNLLADYSYDFYVRVHCDVTADWSDAGTFKTMATCPRPTGLAVSAITTTSAQLGWTDVNSGSEWDILLLKGYPNAPATPPVDPVPGAGEYLINVTNPNTTAPNTFSYSINTLEPTTIYYYYVRKICQGSDGKSVWQGPFIFNTLTCEDTNKCSYKFILTDLGNDGWNNGRMKVRQKGIVVATIGASITGSGPTTVSVSLCNGVPFDIYWSDEGTKPAEIGLEVQNPFADVVYKKKPGEGAANTILFPPAGETVLVNCNAPTCPKPSDLKVDSVSSTSAKLSWTENGIPGATQWNVYVVPKGSDAPVNGKPDAAGSSVKPYYVTDKNPFTIPVGDLQPSKAYDFYVRSMCSGADVSTWTILSYGSFVTTPANDNCDDINGIVVPVNTGVNCDAIVSGTTYGGTQSQPLTSPLCSGNTSDDIWYKFVATSDKHLITFKNIVGGTTDLNHVVYSGTNCSNMQQMYCSDPDVSVASGLEVGKTYFIRVYTKGNDKAQSATFDLCITTPPLITNDECENAIDLPVNKDVECIDSVDASLTRATVSSQNNVCLGTADDDVWFKFVAKTNSHFITLSDVVGTTKNINYAIYSGDCGNLIKVYCSSSNSLQSNFTSFLPGQTYYVRVWSFEPEKQGVDFNICITTINPPISTDDSKYSDKQLVEDVLLGTKCAGVENVSSSTGTKYGSVNGIGYFNKGNSYFAFKDGVVLTSGKVANVAGPNSATNSDGTKLWLGDKDLEKIILGGTGQVMNSFNASVLEFDFHPITDKLSFNFLFASDEYPIFQCAYADAFAFILTNLDTKVSENLAVVPNTTTPVSVITIRDQKYRPNCSSVNAEYFDKLYGPGGLSVLGDPINFNGMTVPMKAQATVIPGGNYHIKLVIADRADEQYDSAVFLEGGSFTTGSAENDLGPDKLISDGTALCNGDVQELSISLSPDRYEFQWYKDGNILPGETNPKYSVTETGTYVIESKLKNSICIDNYTVRIEYYPAAGKPSDLIKCNALSTDIFNLTENTAKIMAPYNGSADFTLAYFETEDNAKNNVDPIQNLESYENKSNPQTIYARVDNHIANCSEVISFQLKLQDKTPKFTIGGSANVCLDGSTTLTVNPTNGFDPKAVSYQWKKENIDIADATSQSLLVKGIDIQGPTIYGVTVNDSGCPAFQEVTVTPVDCNVQKGLSPDGDGKNDNFDLTAMNPKRLDIYNRYGSEVYSKENYTNEWHGQSNSGKDLPDGTYFYEIHTKDNKLKSGWIYISRKQK